MLPDAHKDSIFLSNILFTALTGSCLLILYMLYLLQGAAFFDLARFSVEPVCVVFDPLMLLCLILLAHDLLRCPNVWLGAHGLVRSSLCLGFLFFFWG
jgi:hypothetical protein